MGRPLAVRAMPSSPIIVEPPSPLESEVSDDEDEDGGSVRNPMRASSDSRLGYFLNNLSNSDLCSRRMP